MSTHQNITEYMRGLGRAARAAQVRIAAADTHTKNTAVVAIGEQLTARADAILAANAQDIAAGEARNLTSAVLDRLRLDAARIAYMTASCQQVADLPDPVGEITDMQYQPNGLHIGKMRVPLGTIGMVYESRPNVTVDASVLCLKAGNAVILRGGSESLHSNRAILQAVAAGLRYAGLPDTTVQFVDTTDRAAVGVLITMDEYVDLLVPRGGKDLIARISGEASVPVLRHLQGICHVYIDAAADATKAIAVAYNAKARRYGICGAMETLLVAAPIASTVLPPLCEQYFARGVELRGCAAARAIVPQMLPATEADWQCEYLDAILAVRILDGLQDAISHINTYGSHHTDAIVTENLSHSRRFLREVDSSSVMVNASTQFADGFEYGLGAEIGISTDKLHARGPVGLHGLTCQKYIVFGDGHTRD